jgi:hypothetical protein
MNIITQGYGSDSSIISQGYGFLVTSGAPSGIVPVISGVIYDVITKVNSSNPIHNGAVIYVAVPKNIYKSIHSYSVSTDIDVSGVMNKFTNRVGWRG